LCRRVVHAEVEGSGRKVHFWFDRNQNLYGYMRELYTKFQTHKGKAVIADEIVGKLGDIAEGNKDDHPAMQGADLLAFVSYHLGLHHMHQQTVEIGSGIEHAINRFGRMKHKPQLKALDEAIMREWLTLLPATIRDGTVG
jgi:hypothetical protein